MSMAIFNSYVSHCQRVIASRSSKKVDGHPGGSMAGSSQKLIGYQELYHAGYQGLP